MLYSLPQQGKQKSSSSSNYEHFLSIYPCCLKLFSVFLLWKTKGNTYLIKNTVKKLEKNNFLIYFCDGNTELSAAITPVFRTEVFFILKLNSKSFIKKCKFLCPTTVDVWKDISMNINIKTFFV